MKASLEMEKQIARKFKALAHPARIRLLKDLMKKECCVGEIQKCLSISQPNASQHLKVLKEAGIIEGKRRQNKICYRLSDGDTEMILKKFFKGES